MIKFGTDGWRAIISEEFTFDNVRKVARAMAKYLLGQRPKTEDQRPLIIGYDTRFLADKFAEEIALVMQATGINCLLADRDTPTPVIAWEVRQRKTAGAVVITASHSSPEYCGIKFLLDHAGPANEKITAQLQDDSNQETFFPIGPKKGQTTRLNFRDQYLASIKSTVDAEAIRSSKLKIVLDPMYGSGRGYLESILLDFNCQVESIHSYRDVLFGGQNPEPVAEHLGELKQKVLALSADVGLANDGNADRFAVIGNDGRFYSADQSSAMLSHYLAARNNQRGGPVIHGHIPEKDGILAGLLMVEMLAKSKKLLAQIWRDFNLR